MSDSSSSSSRIPSNALLVAREAELRAAAEAFAATGDSSAWVGAVYPLVFDYLGHLARRMGIDPESVQSAFVDQRMSSRALASRISKANRPLGYLKTAVYSFVVDEQRHALPESRTTSLDVERLANVEALDDRDALRNNESLRNDEALCDDEPRARWESEDDREEHDDEDHAHLVARVREIRSQLPMRDWVLLLAQFVGAWNLGPEERAWVAERRGIDLAQLDEELAKDEERVEQHRRELRSKLMSISERIPASLHRIAVETAKLRDPRLAFAPPKERAAAADLVASQVAQLDSLERRAKELRETIADPFCGRPDRTRIAERVGELHDGISPATATNSAWAQARRVAARLRRPTKP